MSISTQQVLLPPCLVTEQQTLPTVWNITVLVIINTYVVRSCITDIVITDILTEMKQIRRTSMSPVVGVSLQVNLVNCAVQFGYPSTINVVSKVDRCRKVMPITRSRQVPPLEQKQSRMPA